MMIGLVSLLLLFGRIGVAVPLTDIYIGGLFPFRGSWHGGQALMTAAQMAIDHINARPDLLPGYRLNMIWNDTQCSAGIGVRMLYDQIYTPPVKIMTMGAACSAVSEATAVTSHLWNVVQLSPASVSPDLSIKSKYPKFARVASPDTVMNPARLELFRQFGWAKIATISQAYQLFSLVVSDLTKRLKGTDMAIFISEIFQDDPRLQVQNLKAHDARIIVGGFYEDHAGKVFCEAYKIGLYGPKIVWILPGWYNNNWWMSASEFTNCTAEEVAIAAEGYISTGVFYLNPKQDRGLSGLTSNDFLEQFGNLTNHETLFGNNMAPQAYDASWAIAQTLNATLTNLIDSGSPKRLEDFSYFDDEFGDLIYSSLKQLNYLGVRGQMSFDDNGDPVALIKIARLQTNTTTCCTHNYNIYSFIIILGEIVIGHIFIYWFRLGGQKYNFTNSRDDRVIEVVGTYDPNNNGSVQWSDSTHIRWEGGKPPIDSIRTRLEMVTVSSEAFIIVSCLSSCGIALAISFLIFNILCRNERIIKMSSPRLNNVILVGCMVMYISVMFQDTSQHEGAIYCKVNSFLMTLGFSLSFGALFAKTWRVHVIFTNAKLKRRVLKDSQLFLMVGFLVLTNFSILIVREIIDPVFMQTMDLPNLIIDNGETIVIRKVERCDSIYANYFQWTLYAVQGLFLLFGAFLAWETRNVTIEALNDSKYIGMCVYNVMVLSVVGVTISLALDGNVEFQYVFTAACVIMATVVTQILVFVPKVMKYRDYRIHPELYKETSTRIGTMNTMNNTSAQ